MKLSGAITGAFTALANVRLRCSQVVNLESIQGVDTGAGAFDARGLDRFAPDCRLDYQPRIGQHASQSGQLAELMGSLVQELCEAGRVLECRRQWFGNEGPVP